MEKVLLESVREQRRSRRWGILFKSLTFVYLFALLAIFIGDWEKAPPLHKGEHTALIEVDGLIAAGRDASADNIVAGLRAAFEDDQTAGIILRINSPGGSPVQAGYVFDEIRRLRKKYPDTPLYAVVTDVCASGGYYIAAAADKIYANKASIVGSIGVRMDSFGFVEALEKLGIERRLLTSGENKGMLDPFLPVDQEEVAHVKGMLRNIHQQFIDIVKAGRGERLADDPRLFSGLVWTGEQALKLGLVDELRSASEVAREVIGVDTIRDFTPKEDLLKRFADRLGMALSRELSAILNTPALR
ncbi:MAG: signal peptide peptidase SppA [Gammaproteobacteria bacterium]